MKEGLNVKKTNMLKETSGVENGESGQYEYLSERSPEFNEALQGIDLDLMRRLLQEEAEKCGREKGGSLNFLDTARIGETETRAKDDSIPISFYDSSTNEIQVDFTGMEQQAERQNPFLSKDGFRAYLVAVLTHEQIHATTELQTLGYVGYQHFNSYQVWNEGATEKLARELTEKYFKSSANFKKIDQAKSYNYESAVLLIDAVIAKISAQTGFDQETVWGAIKRGMFENTNLETKELQELFDGTLPLDFFKKLRTMSTANEAEIHELIEHLNQGTIQKIVERLVKFLHLEKPSSSQKAA